MSSGDYLESNKSIRQSNGKYCDNARCVVSLNNSQKEIQKKFGLVTGIRFKDITPLCTALQVLYASTLLCPPLFYILAAEKERLKALKQWCRLKSNQVNVMLRHGGTENSGEPTNDGSGPANDDVEAAAGQRSWERQDRGGSPSQAGAGHRGQAEEQDPSQKAARLKAMNDGAGPAHDVIVTRVMMSSCHDGPGDLYLGLAAAGQSSGERLHVSPGHSSE
jgi:hypothetical protein